MDGVERDAGKKEKRGRNVGKCPAYPIDVLGEPVYLLRAGHDAGAVSAVGPGLGVLGGGWGGGGGGQGEGLKGGTQEGREKQINRKKKAGKGQSSSGIQLDRQQADHTERQGVVVRWGRQDQALSRSPGQASQTLLAFFFLNPGDGRSVVNSLRESKC